MATSPPFNDTIGALLIGTFLSLLLYGLALHQAYQYFTTYPQDKLRLKIYVFSVLVLETICTALTMHICYFYMVLSFNDPDSLLSVSWSSSAFPFVAAVTVTVSQCFFMHRVWVVGPSYRFLVIIAAILTVVELAMSFAMAADSAIIKTWDNLAKWTWFVSAHNASSAFSDFITTGVLVYTLHQSRTGLRRTDSMINVLILYAISTGFITGVYNIVCFIFTIVLPHDLIYYATIIVGIKLYSNSLLAALNSRQLILARHQSSVTDTSPFGISIYGDLGVGRSPERDTHSQVQFSHSTSGNYRARVAMPSESIQLKVTRNVQIACESVGESDLSVLKT